MFGFIFTAVLNGVAVWFAAKYIKGIQVTDFARAILIGLVFAVLNYTLGSLLDFITTPIRWLTMGLFSLVVDALLLMLADYFLKGLTIKNFWYALALATIIGAINSVAHWIFN